MTKTRTIEIPENAYEEIREFAESRSENMSALVHDAIFYYLDDLKDIEEYRQDEENGTLETRSLGEVIERLGLE